jgi:hypothetical protein
MKMVSSVGSCTTEDRRDRSIGLTVERLLVGDVVHEQDTHGSSVVGRRDGTEPFLTWRDEMTG